MEILLADDDVSAQRLTHLLIRHGHSVTAAKDGADAWGALQGKAFPLAVLCAVMPGVDGLELCKRLRARADMPYTCVIMLTDTDDRAARTAALTAGADVVLTKPVDSSDFEARIKVAERIVASHWNGYVTASVPSPGAAFSPWP